MNRFVIFGTPGGQDVGVNVTHVVAVEQQADPLVDGGDELTCRLWLTGDLWTDDARQNGQRYVVVTGCLLDVQTMLNGRSD